MPASCSAPARLRVPCLGSPGPLGLENRVQVPGSPSNRVELSVDITEQEMGGIDTLFTGPRPLIMCLYQFLIQSTHISYLYLLHHLSRLVSRLFRQVVEAGLITSLLLGSGLPASALPASGLENRVQIPGSPSNWVELSMDISEQEMGGY